MSEIKYSTQKYNGKLNYLSARCDDLNTSSHKEMTIEQSRSERLGEIREVYEELMTLIQTYTSVLYGTLDSMRQMGELIEVTDIENAAQMNQLQGPVSSDDSDDSEEP